MKNYNDLFYTCSLIEYIARKCKKKRIQIVNELGTETLNRIYRLAGTFHCEPIEKVATDFIQLKKISCGNFDNVVNCKYQVPDYWDIGDVYARLIEDNLGDESNSDQVIEQLEKIYSSFISDQICNYNSDFFYQPRDYIALCYKEKKII